MGRQQWGGGDGNQLVQWGSTQEVLEGCSGGGVGHHRTVPWSYGQGVFPNWLLILSFINSSGFPLPILFTVASKWLLASCDGSVIGSSFEVK